MSQPFEKRCAGCSFVKQLDEFYRVKRAPGTDYYCKQCRRDRARAWGRENAQRVRDRAAAWRLANPEADRSNHFRVKYGITLAEYDALFEAQGGLCAVCGERCSTGRRLSVDHDHATGRVRALLCGGCNTSIGLLGEDPERMRRLAAYVERRASHLVDRPAGL